MFDNSLKSDFFFLFFLFFFVEFTFEKCIVF
jgi:hypothetical protein